MRIGAGIVVAAALVMAAAALFGMEGRADPPAKAGGTVGNRALTPDEERVILRKGTERPFSGKYWNLHEDGTYRCRRCGAPLFPSSAKFDSGTGWPSFDDAFPGAVREVPDADGLRTEIVCARCGAHLGHVFRGEGFTAKQTRHCVNSVSLEFEPGASPGTPAGPSAGGARASAKDPADVVLAGTCAARGDPAAGTDGGAAGRTAPVGGSPATADAYFAGGCFWGVEYFFDRAPGVVRAESGYMGGHVDHPTYRQVSGHGTGHVETVHVVYDPSKTSYEALAKRFFEIHDPTQVDRQGPDVGEQYRSVVFYVDDEQRRAAQALIDRLVLRGYVVATRLEPATRFWPAEKVHQDYYRQKGTTPYCHSRVDRFGED